MKNFLFAIIIAVLSGCCRESFYAVSIADNAHGGVYKDSRQILQLPRTSYIIRKNDILYITQNAERKSTDKSGKIYASSAILTHRSFALTYYLCEVLGLYRSIRPFGCTQNSVSPVFRAPRASGSCPGAWPWWDRRYEGYRICLWLLTWWRACCRVELPLEKLWTICGLMRVLIT